MFVHHVARRLLASSLFLAPLAAAHGQAPFTYHVAHRLQVGGEGNFDYLSFDQSHGRLFVTRVGGVEVFDANKPDLALVAEIPGSPGNLTNDAVLVEDRDLGFTSNGTGGSTTLFRLSTLDVLGTFALGEETDAAVYDDTSGLAVFFSGVGQEAVFYDIAGRQIVGRIALGASPEFAVDDHAGSIYVNLPSKGQVARIDMRSRRIVSLFPVDPSCQANSSIDIDIADRLLFVGCFNGVLDVLDRNTGTTVSTLPIGLLSDAVLYDAEIRTVFAVSVYGSITAISVHGHSEQTPLGVAKTPFGTHTLAEDFRTHRLFTDTATFGNFEKKSPLPPVIPGTFKVLTLQP